MQRRKFFALTGTFTGGALLLPDFLYSYGSQRTLITGKESVVFIQLNGGNDGLNTFVPIQDPLYSELRPAIALNKNDVLGLHKGMAFHPALRGMAKMQQDGNLTVIQNVGYPEPNRSHFRSREIWQTASASTDYLSDGWLGRYLDLQCSDHQPTAGINIDTTDNLALQGVEANAITVKDPNRFKFRRDVEETVTLSENPQLDFARKIANSIPEGSKEIQQALSKANEEVNYPKSQTGRNLSWIARLIKGEMNTKVYYTSLGGFDTHNEQVNTHKRRLTELDEALSSFYTDLKTSGLLDQTTIVVFSEFGRRVKDNGRGTDHGKAAPMFIIGGGNKGQILGPNPNLADLDEGDLKYTTDFRSVYASILEDRLGFDARQIGITQQKAKGIFS